MLIFNCTERAAAHLYPEYRKDRQDTFFSPTGGRTIAADDAALTLPGARHLMFVVHLIVHHRQRCLVALDYHTRQVHIIQGVRKGDSRDFIQRLRHRLICAAAVECGEYRLLSAQHLENGIAEFDRQHATVCFLVRSDRSCNQHIAQAVDEYRYLVNRAGRSPDDSEGLQVDTDLNHMLRKTRQDSDYFYPVQRMVARWLADYQGWRRTDAEAAADKVVRRPGPDLRQRL
ncbi:hypothetical protein L2D25_26465 [Salmonella enterica subsp. enterica serovar Muenchen]|uniref:DUF6933 domain-containing protein n=1 Tax=Salmonella enterica TaxID=28901 RepID=UPI001F0F32BE|nr:hypothetical protein [Salmonella enterica]EAW2474456.1 hypothetical protein [Salmonella enterica subsp. enterica]EEJ6214513.1 hypothetical protein [Salmonella enterica]MCH5444903.1 hypothetical protein [Salmonella enterica subsp. enterica serovar Muenchen]